MNISSLVRENIKKLKPYTSARDSYLSGVLMDANENPLGSVVEAYDDLELNRYPDPNQNLLRDKLAEYLNVGKNNLFAGVGSDEVIDLLIRIFCEPASDKVCILEPTYGMYKVACDVNNVETVSVGLNSEFQIDIEAVQNSIDERVKLIFICSPNNPTGNLINKNDILELASRFKGIVIVDQAYIDFSDESILLDDIHEKRNVVLLRTFSKAWGLAGVRFGIAVADSEIINYLFKVKAPYNLNKLTARVVLDALENKAKKYEFVKSIISERERIAAALKKNSKIEKVYASDANYILFKCTGHYELFEGLIKRGIIIRDRSAQPNLSNCLRITVGAKEENELFLQALNDILT